MNIDISFSAPQATSYQTPDFPVVRFDNELSAYQESLLDGQLYVANPSAIGRAKSREWMYRALHGGATSARPLRTRQHAFQLEVDGQLLSDRWRWGEAREVPAGKAGCREAVVYLTHGL